MSQMRSSSPPRLRGTLQTRRRSGVRVAGSEKEPSIAPRKPPCMPLYCTNRNRNRDKQHREREMTG